MENDIFTTERDLPERLLRLMDALSPPQQDTVREAIRVVRNARPIPVTERLPNELTTVLVLWDSDRCKKWITACWSGAFWDDEQLTPTLIDRDEVTHWLPLPPKPE